MSSWKNNEKSILDYMRPKQPLQRLESSVNKCINVVIPLHLELLTKHAFNIKKFQQLKEWNRVRQEHVNATRTVEQLKADLWSLDLLRNQTVDEDIPKFNKLVEKSQLAVSTTITDFLDVSKTMPSYIEDTGGIQNTESSSDQQTGKVDSEQLTKAFAQIDEEQALRESIEQQSIAAASWDELANSIEDLHQSLQVISNLVHNQQETVNHIEKNIESADQNVFSGTKHLAKARMYKTYIYPFAGAVVGGCIGGPVGLFVGLKAGAAAVAVGGIIGFTSGFKIKKKVEKTVELEMNYLNLMRMDNSTSQKSCSLPDMRIICNENEDGFMNVSKLLKPR